MAPPFVEVYEEEVDIVPRPGERTPPRVTIRMPIYKDGMHRAWIAREEGAMLNCIMVSGAIQTHRPYAYPNAWADVVEYPSKEERKIKKHFRREKEYSYMRPLRALRQVGDTLPAAEYDIAYR